MNILYTKTIPSFGIAGNFTGHLEQAGEASDFVNIKSERNAPKAIFPTYIPNSKTAPSFLSIFPFHTTKIIFPKGEKKVQIEPECALIFDAKWENDKLIELTPTLFGASNDCSIRRENAPKISVKKNWGEASKGFSDRLIPLDNFTSQGVLNKYRISSFLIRNNDVHIYGEDSAVRDYSYIYDKLTEWMLDKFNNQKDEGPAEEIHKYLLDCEHPKKIMVSIGATRYTQWGKNNFLQNGDVAAIILYPEDEYTQERIISLVKSGKINDERVSALIQQVVL